VVVDSAALLSLSSRLLQTAGDVPVLVAAAESAPASTVQSLTERGIEVFHCSGSDHAERLDALLVELGRRRMTNVLVEGGGRLLGTLFETRAIDEVHVFIAPKIIGGDAAKSPVGGDGVASVAKALALNDISIEELGGDVYVQGRIRG
jgi:diaminohydroxyphosphoribosylaminopyrimidine deaminase/5-amino-6-(5-phosphoribosylamino)uracil reductase